MLIIKGTKLIFQSTLPHGERLLAHLGEQAILNISIHAPAWGATYVWLYGRATSEISIHAPAWGATEPRARHEYLNRISIHAPAWGATIKQSTDGNRLDHFNPRSRMGSDIRRRSRIVLLTVISIHAPAWGATAKT